ATSGCSLSAVRRVTQAVNPSRAKRRAIAPPVASPAPTTNATFASATGLLQLRVRRGRENGTRDVGNNRPVFLAFRALPQPVRIAHERSPDALTLGQVLPLEQVGQVLVAFADHRGPETDRLETVLVPDFQRHALEALVQVG